MENELERLKLQIEATNINFETLKNASQLCCTTPVKNAKSTTCGPLCQNFSVRIENLEDVAQKSKDDMEVIERAFIDLSDECTKYNTKSDQQQLQFNNLSSELADLQARFEGSENLISEAYEEVEHKIASLSAERSVTNDVDSTTSHEVSPEHDRAPRARAATESTNAHTVSCPTKVTIQYMLHAGSDRRNVASTTDLKKL